MIRSISKNSAHYFFVGAAALVVVGLTALAACNPAFNWREVRPENTRLSLLLPCKPDKAEKIVPLGGQPIALAMIGCDASGATFAVATADLGDASKSALVLAHWQGLTLANMKAPALSWPGNSGNLSKPAVATQLRPLKLPYAAGTPLPMFSVLVKAQGQRADGTVVEGQAAYFAQGSQVFQVVLYAKKINPEVADTFFSSLKFE